MSETQLVILMDRSGSMMGIKADMEGGFDQLMLDQSQVEGDCYVTLVQFDSDSIDVVFTGVSVDAVRPIELKPRSMTPLLDALGQTMARTGERLRQRGTEQPDHVIFVIMTDGQENASIEFKLSDVKAMIEGYASKGWTFMYLGANVDAFSEAGRLGISASCSLGYDASEQGVKDAYGAMGAAVSEVRKGGEADLSKDSTGP